MPIKVGGVDYQINLDTGSSDFMIKGEKTNGIPTQKYSCKDHDC